MELMNCPKCQKNDRISIRGGAGPHHSRLQCDRCGRWVKWLSANQSQQIRQQLDAESKNDANRFASPN